jgi:hypothetical protein
MIAAEFYMMRARNFDALVPDVRKLTVFSYPGIINTDLACISRSRTKYEFRSQTDGVQCNETLRISAERSLCVQTNNAAAGMRGPRKPAGGGKRARGSSVLKDARGGGGRGAGEDGSGGPDAQGRATIKSSPAPIENPRITAAWAPRTCAAWT